MRQVLKQGLLSNRAGRFIYDRVQEHWFESTYRSRRERYEQAVASQPEAWSQRSHIERARAKIATRGYTPTLRKAGKVHTFAYLPSSWQHQNQIANALTQMGPVTRYDYVARGTSLPSLRTATTGHSERRQQVLAEMIEALRVAHRERPVDWFFSYSLGWDMDAQTQQRIHEELGIPTVNLSLDDKNWWDEIERGDKRSALKNIAPLYDLGWTSARIVLPWYWAEGGQAIFLPEGVNSDWFRPLPGVEQDIEVGFVGSRFGYRPTIVEQLRRAGIKLMVYGDRWPSGVLSDEEMLSFFNRCKINLGLGDMHYSRTMTNLKGRDFEIPSTGRGLYLTAFNSDLATCFRVRRNHRASTALPEEHRRGDRDGAQGARTLPARAPMEEQVRVCAHCAWGHGAWTRPVLKWILPRCG